METFGWYRLTGLLHQQYLVAPLASKEKSPRFPGGGFPFYSFCGVHLPAVLIITFGALHGYLVTGAVAGGGCAGSGAGCAAAAPGKSHQQQNKNSPTGYPHPRRSQKVTSVGTADPGLGR